LPNLIQDFKICRSKDSKNCDSSFYCESNFSHKTLRNSTILQKSFPEFLVFFAANNHPSSHVEQHLLPSDTLALEYETAVKGVVGNHLR